MAKLLQIALLGHPVLRQKAKEVQNARDPRIQSLIDEGDDPLKRSTDSSCG